MNAVVALCHFCEAHGPKIIFYTQVLHDNNRYAKQNQTTNHENDDNESKTSSNSSSSKVDTCDACGSIPIGQRGLVSLDKSAEIVYVSRHELDSPELYTVLRHACIRSLSCEICPGREGPVIFGDSLKGYVFSYTFSLKDVEARGQQKWYSIIIVSKDKIFLINSWNFFIRHIQKITSNLQAKALKVYESERKQVKRNPYRTTSFDLGPFSRKRSGTGKATRSLIDILKDSDIFTELHSYFTWILKEGASHFTERSLEGPSLNFDNNVIDIDKKYTIDAHFDSLLQLSQAMNFEDFLILCQHVILGNQIIIRSSVDSFISSAIDILQSLLPSGCCKVIYKNSEYQDSWKCNFLGIDLCTEIPSHILVSDLYALLDIIPLAHHLDGSGSSRSGAGFNLHIRVNLTTHRSKWKDKPPSLITKLGTLLSDVKTTPTVVNQFLLAIKQEYMNKAKLFYKFIKTEYHTEQETKKLLEILDVSGHDVDVLKFWTRGLNSDCCSHLRNAQLNSPSLVFATTR